MEDVNPSGKHGPKKRHHGQGTIREYRDHWRREPFVWMLRGMDRTGKRVVLASCSGASRREAERKARELLRDLDRGASTDGLSLTVADILARYLRGISDAVTPATFDRYSGIAAKLGTWFEGERVVRLEATDVRARLRGTPAQQGYALLVLRAACRAAVRERLIPSDPTMGIRPPRVTTKREAPTIDAPTAAKIIAATAEEPEGPLVALALTTGLRRGELLGLRWQDVGPDSLRVRYSLRRIPPEFRVAGEGPTRMVEPKTERSARLLPLPEIAREALAVQRDRQAKWRREAKVWAENDLVFTDEHGNPMWPGTVTKHVEALLRRIVPGMRLHDTRHTWETLLASQGTGQHVRMALAGHTTVTQTMEYTHVIPEDARRAAEGLDEMLRRAG